MSSTAVALRAAPPSLCAGQSDTLLCCELLSQLRLSLSLSFLSHLYRASHSSSKVIKSSGRSLNHRRRVLFNSFFQFQLPISLVHPPFQVTITMSYNRYGNVGGVGGGYPPNQGGMPPYNHQPMQPVPHQPPPHQYGQPYGNRQSGGWNMHPGPMGHPPPGQQMSPWINNNIPTSFRGYPPVHDNRNQNMGNMGMALKPNLRMVSFL